MRNLDFVIFTGILILSSQLFAMAEISGPKPLELPTLYVVHIIPGDATNYTVSKEVSDIEKSTRLAVRDFQSAHPECRFRQDFTFKSGSEAELFEKVSSISKQPGKKVAVGFSRSSLARLAAKAAQETDLVGISIGASAEDLRTINANFVTMASPWHGQWAAIQARMNTLTCAPESTLVIGDVKDSYSYNFQKSAEEAGFRKTFNVDSSEIKQHFDQISNHARCIFLAMNMSTSHLLLSKLISNRWHGSVFGTGDWSYYAGELNELIQNSKTISVTRVIVPTGWDPNENEASIRQSNRFAQVLTHAPEPNGVYSYDAVLLGLSYLCLGSNPSEFDREKLRKLHLVRSYSGVSNGGNYLSPIRLVTYGNK